MFSSTFSALAGGGGGSPTKQMRSWLFTSNGINFNSGIAAAFTQFSGTSGTGAKQVAGAAYNNANQLMFYIGNRGFTGPSATYADRTVFTPANVAVGQLNYLVNSAKASDETDWIVTGQEMAVVPVPGVCSRYYVFFMLAGNYTSVLAYAIIDCSGSSPSIYQNTTRLDASALYGLGTVSPGIAVSQLYPDGSRNLFVAGGTRVSSYKLPNGGGIGSRTDPLATGSFYGAYEAELSPDKNWLAWNKFNSSQVYLFNIATSALTSFTPTFASGTTHDVSGLEFSSVGDKLFITGSIGTTSPYTSGASVYTMASAAQSSISVGSLATNTQLELAFDGLLYAASSTGSLLTLNPSGTLAFAASPLSTTISRIGYANTLYGLPDQIDGENYTSYFGNYAPTVSATIVDGVTLTGGVFRNVYSCKPLTLTATASPNVSLLSVVINSTDASGNVTGAYSYTYSPATLPVGLGALNGGYLASAAHTGYYRIQITGTTPCGQTTTSTGLAYISTFTPGSAGYAFNLCAGTGPQASATSSSSPALLGANSGGGIDISFSTGGYTNYQVEMFQYSGGVWASLGSTGDITKPTTTGGLSTIALSYLANLITGSSAYFNTGQPGGGITTQLVLTVSNPCGTSPPLTGYFQTGNILCRPFAGPAGATAAPEQAALHPNPLTGAEPGHLRFTLPTAQPVTLTLTDALTGKVRLTVLQNAPREAGPQDVLLDAARLPAGVYLYHLRTASGTAVGRVLKGE